MILIGYENLLEILVRGQRALQKLRFDFYIKIKAVGNGKRVQAGQDHRVLIRCGCERGSRDIGNGGMPGINGRLQICPEAGGGIFPQLPGFGQVVASGGGSGDTDTVRIKDGKACGIQGE